MATRWRSWTGSSPATSVVVDGADRLRDGSDVTIPNPSQQKIAQPSGAAGDAARTAQRAQAQAAIAKSCSADIAKLCNGQTGRGADAMPRSESRFAVGRLQDRDGFAQAAALAGPARRRVRRRALIRPAHVTLHTFYPKAGRDIAVDDRNPLGRFSPAIAICRCRRCRKWITPPSRFRASIRGASPDVMTTSVTAILERQFGQMPGLKEMSSISSAALRCQHSSSTLISVWMWPNRKCRRRSMPAAVFCRSFPVPPVYAKGQSRRRAGNHNWRSPRRACLSPLWENLADTRIGPEDFPALRRRSGEHFRCAAAGGAGAGQSAAIGVLRPQHRRPSHHHQTTTIPTRPRAASTVSPSPTPSTPTISFRAPPTTPTSSSPIKMARRCICRMSPR